MTITNAADDKFCNIFPYFWKKKVWYFMRIVCQQTILMKYCALLAHLSQRLMGELIVYQSLRRPSVVRPSTFSNIFSSETTGPIKLKFYMETPRDAGTKVCSNCPDHMTKMAATPIYGKNPLKIFFSRTRRPMTS